jgi:plastocyanin
MLAAVAALLGASMIAGNGSQAEAAKTTTIGVGGGAAGVAVELFRPDNVVVNVGDTIAFSNTYEEPHTVTYIKNPADIAPGLEGFSTPLGTPSAFNGAATLNSGLLEKGQTFSVTFASGGAYHFLCLLHPGMKIDISVVGAGVFTPPVDTAAADATLKAGIAAGEAASAAVKVPSPTKNASGTSTSTVVTGPSISFGGATVDVMRFMPAKIEIGVGDTITWSNTTGVPHTVTFLAGPPPADFDPFTTKVPNKNFDPTKLYSALISAAPEFGGVQTFSLTFTQPGTYNYICVLHADQGMAGVITVGPAGSAGAGGGAIKPPSTGDGGLLGQSSGATMMYAGVAMLVASALAAGGLAFVRRDA